MSVTAPSDRRFRRSQIPAARRRHLRARPWWRVVKVVVLVGLFAGAVSWAVAAAVDLPWLRVQQVRVHGNQRVHAGEVAALLEGMTGQSLLAVDLDRWRARLFASAWVADATLRRRLPGTIDVELRERVPMGIARAGADLFLVDAAGTVIDEYGPRYADCDLPIIDGIIVTPVSVPPAIDRPRGQLVSRLMSELRTRPELARRISQIDAVNVHDVHVILDGDPAVYASARPSSWSASTGTSACRRRCGSRCRTSITWTCASASACTSASRRRPGPRRRRAAFRCPFAARVRG